MQTGDLRHRLDSVIRQSPSRGKIRRIALFGSRARGDAAEDSDIDLLIEFLDDTMGALEFVRIERELSEQLGMKVDLVEPEALSKYFRGDVLREAQQIYPA